MPTMSIPELRADKDYTPPQSSKDVREFSESEPLVEEGTLKAIDAAKRIASKWDERCKKEGKIKWYFPLDTSRDRRLFDTKQACQKHIAANFKMMVQQAKLEKRPKEDYQPKSMLISPKRTLADMVLPEHRHLYNTDQSAARNIQNLGKLAQANASAGFTAGVLVGMMENQAIAKVKSLDDKELERCTHQSYYRSKRRLFKACKAEMDRRGIPVRV